MNTKIPIGISSCLLGNKVRFDSGHKHSRYITQVLSEYFDYVSFCPEVNIGLGVPREPIRLITSPSQHTSRGQEESRCVGVHSPQLDITEALKSCADKQSAWHSSLYGYIVKKDSPSCGMERVKRYYNNHPERTGVGLYTERLMKNYPYLPVEEEGRLNDLRLRENFITRVFFYYHWKNSVEKKPTWKSLYHFHAQYKLRYMSHNQNKMRELGRWLAGAKNLSLESAIQGYISQATEILKIIPNTKNHTNTLQHIQGYLKRHLDPADKKELNENILQYQAGKLPLVVPLTLLKHHFRKHNHPYISNSLYLQPHPKPLMLLNNV